MRRWLFCLILLAACGSATDAPVPPVVDGDWAGTVTTGYGNRFEFFVSVTEDAVGVIAGTGQIQAQLGQGSVINLPLDVRGAHAHPAVSMTLTSTGYEAMVLSGDFVGDNRIRGSLDGSGFIGQAVTLDRVVEAK